MASQENIFKEKFLLGVLAQIELFQITCGLEISHGGRLLAQHAQNPRLTSRSKKEKEQKHTVACNWI